MFFKSKLFILIILIAIAATFYYFGDPQKLIGTILPKVEGTVLAPIADKFETIDSSELSQNFQMGVESAETEISGLSQKTIEVSKHAENVLGSSITAATNSATPIHERAFEYGKYVYCKQVVDDYEKTNPSVK